MRMADDARKIAANLLVAVFVVLALAVFLALGFGVGLQRLWALPLLVVTAVVTAAALSLHPGTPHDARVAEKVPRRQVVVGGVAGVWGAMAILLGLIWPFVVRDNVRIFVVVWGAAAFALLRLYWRMLGRHM